MEREAEDPKGHFLVCSFVFGPGEPGESMCDCDVFIAGRFVVLPPDFPTAALHNTNFWHRGGQCDGPAFNNS